MPVEFAGFPFPPFYYVSPPLCFSWGQGNPATVPHNFPACTLWTMWHLLASAVLAQRLQHSEHPGDLVPVIHSLGGWGEHSLCDEGLELLAGFLSPPTSFQLIVHVPTIGPHTETTRRHPSINRLQQQGMEHPWNWAQTFIWGQDFGCARSPVIHY